MKRAAVPILKAVVPGVTQIPPNFGDVTYHTRNPSSPSSSSSPSPSPSSPSSSSSSFSTTTTTTTTTNTVTVSTSTPSFSDWDDNADHQLISAGSLHVDLHSVPSPTLHANSLANELSFTNTKDTLAMVHRVSNVFENLDLDYTHPTTSALVQVVNDTASDPQIVSRIMRLDSFHHLVSSIPNHFSTVERPRVSVPIETTEQEDVQSFINSITSSTQTDDDFTESLESRLQEITMQIAPDIGLTPPVSATSTPTPPSVTPTSSSTSSSYARTNATPVAPNVSDSYTPMEESVGDAGMPGKQSASIADTAVKIVLPLAILAVAAAMFPLPRAVDLLKTGIKFVSRFWTKVPV